MAARDSVDDFVNDGFCVLNLKWPAPKQALHNLIAREFKRLFDSDAKHDRKYNNFICRDKDQLRFDFSPRNPKAVLGLMSHKFLASIESFAKDVLLEDELTMQVRVFASLPGARSQTWHRDTPRTGTFEAMNFFILLNEPDRDLGLTEIVPGSHVKGVRVEKRGKKPQFASPNQVLVFDYSALHRGLPNWSTGTVRYVLAIVYHIKSFTDKNYSSRSVALLPPQE